MDKILVRDKILPHLIHTFECRYRYTRVCDCTANENLERVIDLVIENPNIRTALLIILCCEQRENVQRTLRGTGNRLS